MRWFWPSALRYAASPALSETANCARLYRAHAAPSPAAARRTAAWLPSSAPIAHTSIHLSLQAHPWYASFRLSSYRVQTDLLKPLLKGLRRQPCEGCCEPVEETDDIATPEDTADRDRTNDAVDPRG